MTPEHHIFYVDDDEDDLEIFFDAVSEIPVQAHLYKKGDRLIKALLNPPPVPSVIFLDLNMSPLSGYELLCHMQEMNLYSGVPRVILSTASNLESIRKARECGADYYITKPTSLAKLRKAVEHVLKKDWSAHNLDEDFYYQP